MSNNSTKSYKKDGKNKPWNEYTGPLPSSGQSGTSKELKPEEYPKEIKLFKADSNDATKSVEINTSEYKVKKDGDDHIYEFNDGVECTLVKRDDKEVLMESPQRYIKRVLMAIGKKKVKIQLRKVLRTDLEVLTNQVVEEHKPVQQAVEEKLVQVEVVEEGLHQPVRQAVVEQLVQMDLVVLTNQVVEQLVQADLVEELHQPVQKAVEQMVHLHLVLPCHYVEQVDKVLMAALRMDEVEL
ncbi:hypothetical protein MACK_003658 [Theileria orientalis]|uniref:Uncharacterized protein n=1 Tax=Theileria orientalis TaxID=68886 RepID=A0A976SJH5_THEOR|nr:hypothetical protein MACK_003658 [Theileria orientalis]